MTFREFNLTMIRHELLGKLLPLELRRTYPRLSLEDGALCAAFAGFRISPEKNAVSVFPPAYYLKITYPQCTIRSFERLPVVKDAVKSRQMTPRSRDDIKRLEQLCDESLRCFDDDANNLETKLSEYNALLDSLLEPDQLAVLEKFTHL